MAIPIFWRLVLSHMGVLLLSGAACFYSIVQLGSLSGTARTALDTNHRMISYQEALAEAFLSQVRYGGKYLLTHTDGRHVQLRQFKKDFTDYLEQLKRLGRSESITHSLTTIEQLHARYHALFDREVEYIQLNQNYAQSRYQQEREKIVESTLNELDALKLQLRAKLQERLESIDRAARTARRIAIVTTLVVLILGTVLSLRVSSSIEGPGSVTGAAAPLLMAPWGQAIKNAGVSFAARTHQATEPQLHRLAGCALHLIAVWSRRCVAWRNASLRKGN
jgi:CHASE3 domain sensor protein